MKSTNEKIKADYAEVIAWEERWEKCIHLVAAQLIEKRKAP